MTGFVPFGPDAVARLTVDTEPWLSCDDCFDQVDAVIEATLTSARPVPEPFRVHLAACAVCDEEARSLAALVAPDFALRPEEAVALLTAAVEVATAPPQG